MKIEKASFSNKKRLFTIVTDEGKTFTLPYARLSEASKGGVQIVNAYVDIELGCEAITYSTNTGAEDSVHLDTFLDFNSDPEFVSNVFLYNLTLRALEALEGAGLSIREIARRLGTSPSQVYRLIDTTNYSKSIDNMVRLLAVLGSPLEAERHVVVRRKSDGDLIRLRQRLPYLTEDDFDSTPKSSTFRPLGSRKQAA